MDKVKMVGDRLALAALEVGYALTGTAFVGVLPDGTIRLRCGNWQVAEIDISGWTALDRSELMDLVIERTGGARFA